jgi:hypothetical protein
MGSANPKARDTFDDEKQLVINLIKTPKDTIAKYGIVQFGEDAETRIPLGSDDDEEKLIDFVKILFWKEEGKSLHKGLKKAAMEFEENGRPTARKVLIVFVDGNDDSDKEDLAKVTRTLKTSNVEIIPVLLGDVVDKDKINELIPMNKKPKKGDDPKKLSELVAEEALTGNLKKYLGRGEGGWSVISHLSDGVFRNFISLNSCI